MTNTRIATRIAAVTLTALAFGLAAPSAQAAPVSSTLSVDTTQPGALTIAGHTGLPVTVWTKGASAQTKRPAGSAPVTFANLIPGRAYDVYVGEDKAVRVMNRPESFGGLGYAASDLSSAVVGVAWCCSNSTGGR